MNVTIFAGAPERFSVLEEEKKRRDRVGLHLLSFVCRWLRRFWGVSGGQIGKRQQRSASICKLREKAYWVRTASAVFLIDLASISLCRLLAITPGGESAAESSAQWREISSSVSRPPSGEEDIPRETFSRSRSWALEIQLRHLTLIFPARREREPPSTISTSFWRLRARIHWLTRLNPRPHPCSDT